MKNTHAVFHDLMSCVLEQPIHYRSTKKIFQKILDSAGLERVSPENFDFFAQKAFGQAKLSIQKLETIEAVLDFWRHHMIDWPTLSDTEVRTQISTIKGIGPWTIDMILMYTLQRPNIFPHDDYHLKEIMTRLYGLNPKSRLKAQMLEIAETWEGHKSLAVQYLLAWKAKK